jgi:hypothetical protein
LLDSPFRIGTNDHSYNSHKENDRLL